MLADRTLEIVGTPIAADEGRNLALYRVTPPVRTSTRVSGWYADTWTGPHVVWSRFACRRGVLRLRVSSDSGLFEGVVQRIHVSGATHVRTFLLPATKTRTLSLPLEPVGGLCRVVFDVTPSRKPAADPRLLGVHIAYFNYVPTQ